VPIFPAILSVRDLSLPLNGSTLLCVERISIRAFDGITGFTGFRNPGDEIAGHPVHLPFCFVIS
jgi:hypothetical protein